MIHAFDKKGAQLNIGSNQPFCWLTGCLVVLLIVKFLPWIRLNRQAAAFYNVRVADAILHGRYGFRNGFRQINSGM